MAHSSPGVRRVVAILNFMADHPGQAFTLTDLVRALRLSRATCHGLLTGLVEAGYLYRTSDKTYLLGPALISMGSIAKEHFSPLQVAQPEMRALADEYDAICAACFLEGTDVVIRDRASSMSHVGNAPRGERRPLLAQYASVFFVWSPPAEVEAWLDKVDPPVRADQRQAMLAGIEAIRERRFGVGERSPDWVESAGPVDRPVSWAVLDRSMTPLFALEPETGYFPTYIQAPVYDADRRVAFVLALTGFRATHTGAEIERIGTQVAETCDRISAFIGRIPPGSL